MSGKDLPPISEGSLKAHPTAGWKFLLSKRHKISVLSIELSPKTHSFPLKAFCQSGAMILFSFKCENWLEDVRKLTVHGLKAKDESDEVPQGDRSRRGAVTRGHQIQHVVTHRVSCRQSSGKRRMMKREKKTERKHAIHAKVCFLKTSSSQTD